MGLRGTVSRAVSAVSEQFGDRAMNAIVEAINTIGAVLHDFPLTGNGWVVTEAKAVPATTDTLIVHGLKRKPTGYFPIKIVSAAGVVPKWTTGVTNSYDNTKHINIYTDVACTLTFLVF